jgi:NTP pyrophosphatase (non-canonical NTP hydrolase)
LISSFFSFRGSITWKEEIGNSCYNPRHAKAPHPYPAQISPIHVWIGALPHVNVTAPRCGEPFFYALTLTLSQREREHLKKKKMTGKTIDELTKLMHNFVRSKGWYEKDSPKKQSPRNLAVSLSLEVAEILEHFQWNESFDKEDLAEELADVALYLLQLASIAEIDLEQAILDKLEVNASRNWD